MPSGRQISPRKAKRPPVSLMVLCCKLLHKVQRSLFARLGIDLTPFIGRLAL